MNTASARGGRGRLLAAAALVVAVVLAAVVLIGGGGSDERSSLAWQGSPTFVQSGKPTDRVFQSMVRNDSLREVKVNADKIEVLDPSGKPVRSTARFLQTFAHGIYSWTIEGEEGDFERRRLGEIATIKPGQTMPVTLSWRVPQGAPQPVRVDFGEVSLSLPRAPSKVPVAPRG